MESVSAKNLNRLTEIATNAAEELGLVLLRITARGVPSRPVVEVTLDGPKLVAISDCEIVSKKLNEAIDAESLLSGNFRLDVLSPGLDEPVIHNYQFQRTVGHLVEASFDDQGKKASIVGILKEFSPNELVILKRQKKGSEANAITISRSQIMNVYARPNFG
jgi:ribosome maturation factor RimP